MLTPEIIAQAFDDIRATLPAAQVSVKIAGKVVQALLPTDSRVSKATLVGIDPGYSGTLYAKLSELPTEGLHDGNTLEILTPDGKTWVTRRAQGVEIIGNTVLTATLQAEYIA